MLPVFNTKHIPPSNKPNTNIISNVVPDPGPYLKFENEYPNHLQAIVIPTTSWEINKGQFSKFCDNLIRNTEDAKDIDLVIVVNNSNYSHIRDIPNLEYKFKSVYILNTNIPPHEDIYTSIVPITGVPPLGLTSGPNTLFFETMEYCKRYNTILLIETDCIVYPNWIDKCKKYVNLTEYFLISGSTYDGYMPLYSSTMPMIMHLNGVAFYKTASPIFQFIIQSLKQYIISEVKTRGGSSAYDLMMMDMMLKYLTAPVNFTIHMFWKRVYRYMLKTSLIINVSAKYDSVVTEDEIRSLHKNCVILHKKSL